MEWLPLLAESDAGIAWVIGIGGAIVGIVGSLYGVISKYDRDRMDYLFAQYKATVDRVRKEHEEDRLRLETLEKEHLTCREESASQRERIAGLERELAALKGQQ